LAANRYTAISSVVLTNAATRVYTITLAVNPTGNTGMFLSYAWTGTPGASAGPTTGPRGCIRDSDTFVDVFGNTSRNHLCIERVAVT
jgi:hypothetical protein